MKIRMIFLWFIFQTSYSQWKKKDIENFDELSNKALLIDDILVSRYEKSDKEISHSFFEIVNKEQDFLIVADKKHHRFIPMFHQSISSKTSIYIVLHHETYSNSKYVYALIFKKKRCINLRRIYCNSDVYWPQYNKNFGAQLKENTIKLFDMESGFFEAFNINEEGDVIDEERDINDYFSEVKSYKQSIYSVFFDYYSVNPIPLSSKDNFSSYKVLFPLSKVNIKTHNVIHLPVNVYTKRYESYFILKQSDRDITKIYYLNKCFLTNGEQENVIVREVYKGNQNIKIDNKLETDGG